jgi:alpha-L-fucosidase
LFTRRSVLAALGATGAAAAFGAADLLRAITASAAIPGPASYSASLSSVTQHPLAPESGMPR